MKGLSPKELNELLVKNEPIFIFDVRNVFDFNDWKVEGKEVEYLNIPYFELIDGVEHVMDKLPQDRNVIVICAKEGSSIMVAEMLEEAAGLQANYLIGGMKGWNEYLYPVKVYQDQEITVHQFIRVGKGCLSYMVTSGEEALVVDASRFVDRYIDFANEQGATITHVVDSHLHADHISGGHELAQKTGANYYLMKSEGAVLDFHSLENYEVLTFASITLEVLAVKTPGHTPGSVSFLVNGKVLFSGDTIFVTGLGRPDLGGKAREWAADLYHTVYGKVAQIADDVIVLPGHYAKFAEELHEAGYIGNTLGHIRKMNDVMNGKTVDEFVEVVAAATSSETPPNFEEIVAINRGMRSATLEEKQELEIGPNRCAVHHTH
ncbi:MBL fold metallo-hydrolase [Brevibacillus daliensis]|uniref:MBL fold metallo-hydrolase n=1 Tax=Brevibacillus daliensis TaxID=2892995 RepID=UPI00359F48B9